MGWVRLDDRISEHPKMCKAGPLGLAVFVAGLAYCNRNLTDGFIPTSVASTLLHGGWEDDEGRVWETCVSSGMAGYDFECILIAELLADVGLFHRVPGGFRIHDYEDYQPSKAEVLEKRQKTADRVAKHRKGHVTPPVTPLLTQPPTPTPSNKPPLASTSLEVNQLVENVKAAMRSV